MEYLIRNGGTGLERARQVMRRVAPDTAVLDDVHIEAGASRQTGATVFDLFRAGRGVGTIILWSCLALNSIVYFFVLTWMPLVLVRMGTDESTAILASSLINVSGIIAAFATGPLMDRFNPPRVLALHFVSAAVFAVLVGLILSQNVTMIVPLAMCLGFCVSGLHKGISALAMQFYPIELRSIGLGWTFGVGRLGAVAGPVLAGVQLAAGWTPAQIFYAMLIPLSVGAASALGMNSFYGRNSTEA
jgi:AAHS family 4-hydroxybenzoate transporter-like MFS transporter